MTNSKDQIPPPPVTVSVQVEEGQQGALLQLVADFQAGRVHPTAPAFNFGDKTYPEAARALLSDPSISIPLKKRIAADDIRDPLDALTDAEQLHALQSKRFAEGARQGAVGNAESSIHKEGVEALERLYKVAQGNSGQCRRIALFLLGLYNGNRFPFDLTDFRAIDDELFEDCMRVLRMDARACKQEVHTYFKNGSKLWERMAKDWGAIEFGTLRHLAKEIIDRNDFHHATEQRRAELVTGLKDALHYRGESSDEY